MNCIYGTLPELRGDPTDESFALDSFYPTMVLPTEGSVVLYRFFSFLSCLLLTRIMFKVPAFKVHVCRGL